MPQAQPASLPLFACGRTIYCGISHATYFEALCPRWDILFLATVYTEPGTI